MFYPPLPKLIIKNRSDKRKLCTAIYFNAKDCAYLEFQVFVKFKRICLIIIGQVCNSNLKCIINCCRFSILLRKFTICIVLKHLRELKLLIYKNYKYAVLFVKND